MSKIPRIAFKICCGMLSSGHDTHSLLEPSAAGIPLPTSRIHRQLTVAGSGGGAPPGPSLRMDKQLTAAGGDYSFVISFWLLSSYKGTPVKRMGSAD